MDQKVNRRKKKYDESGILCFEFSFSILEFIYITFRIRLNDCTVGYNLSTRAEQGSEN